MAKVLTQRGVESAKPKPGRYGRNDGIVPGLRLIVYPTGAKSFALFARVNGRLINHRIGDAAVLSLKQARDNAKQQLALIAGGGDPRAVRKAAAEVEEETVEHVARLFIERHAKPRLRTWQEIEWRLNREVLPKWGRRPISSITRRDVIALLDGIVDRGVPVTANRTLTVARKMFSWAIERSLLETSPFDPVKPPTAEVSRDRVLSDPELVLLWRAADQVGYPFGSFVKLLVLTGQRREEVSAMRWPELDPGLTTGACRGSARKTPNPIQCRSCRSVPMVDIRVNADGLRGPDAVELVTKPLEAIVKGIDGGEYVYSQTEDDRVMVTARFLVGTKSEDAILRVHEKIRANLDRIPVGIPEPLIVGRGINEASPCSRFRQSPMRPIASPTRISTNSPTNCAPR